MDEASFRPSCTHLRSWIRELADFLAPSAVMLCDGTEGERQAVERVMRDAGSLLALDAGAHARDFLHRREGAATSSRDAGTYVCTEAREEAGPTNDWLSLAAAERRARPVFSGAMRGRTMYVVPYVLGPIGSPRARNGVQVTDDPYAVLRLRIMTRMGCAALEQLGASTNFLRGVHCLGAPGAERLQLHFPAASEVWTFGAGFAGSRLDGEKGLALRAASVEARDGGWLAEHMLVVGVTSPARETHYIAAALGSGCGNSTLAMLAPKLPGWRVETVADDVCWLYPRPDGRLWAINPLRGLDLRAGEAGSPTNAAALATRTGDAIFTNCALRRGRRVWWAGRSPLEHGEVLDDWAGNAWFSGASTTPAAHPDARFIVDLAGCPTASSSVDEPIGVPISAIVFGGRRAVLTPLVFEAVGWRHGVYVGATMASEEHDAHPSLVLDDPMGMASLCGYNMADYFAHWLRVGRRLEWPPRVFHANWFRAGPHGRPGWPGFGENIRVVKWIFDRLADRVPGRQTPIGIVPNDHELDVSGLDLPPARVQELLQVERAAWLAEARRSWSFLSRFGPRLPTALLLEHRQLLGRLRHAVAGTN